MDNSVDLLLIRDLREQVNSLLAAEQLLAPLVREKGTARDMECLALANQTLYRLIRTVRHLELCRDDGLTARAEPVDVGELCRSLGRSLELAAPSLGASFWWELDQENALTLGDRDLLELALLNLLSNAFQAAGRGGKVVLRMALKGRRILLTVEDDGSGLPPPPAPSEDPFLKRPGGVGLGLDAARRVAQLHGGALVCRDRQGGGLSAVLSLPFHKPDAHTGLHTATREPSGGFSPFLVEFSTLLPWEAYRPEDLD